jgi:phosphoribosylanthranilate isomerase
MFRIKICGITRPEDAVNAADCGADAIGINFFRGSPRCASEAAAGEIVSAVRDRVDVVGVFVNESPAAIVSLCSRLGIRRVQLHGEEEASDAALLPLWRMRAVHVSASPDPEALLAYPCEAFLLDSGGKEAFGGTGRALRWEELADRFPGIARPHVPGDSGRPWVLAGGLDPGNVVRAILSARPFGVDVASGVESSPGRKDPGKVASFIERAREGFRIAEG